MKSAARGPGVHHTGDSPIQPTSTRVSKIKIKTKRSQRTTFPRAPCSAIHAAPFLLFRTHTHTHTKDKSKFDGRSLDHKLPTTDNDKNM